jgi:hypothetical protein
VTAASGILLAAGAAVAVVLLPRVPRTPRGRAPRPAETPRPKGLRAMERQVGLARGSAGDLHERLCPLLRDIARDRLATAGIDLDRDPETAATALGPEIWELVRGDRPPPSDRHGPGASLADIQGAVARLEAIGAGR